MMLTRRSFLGIVASSAICLGLRGRKGFPKWGKESFSDEAETLLPVKVDGHYGYIDRYGTVVIEPRYELWWEFEDGLAPVKIGGKWGFIDTKGSIAIDARFEDALWFGFGRAPVKLNGRWGAIDPEGDMRIPPKFDFPPMFHEGLASVGMSGLDGFIDTEGRWAIPPRYPRSRLGEQAAYSFRDGLAKIRQGDLSGFIDKSGDFVIEPSFRQVSCFSEGFAYAGTTGDCQYIDKAGKPVYPEKLYELCWLFSEGLAPVMEGRLWGYIDKKGRSVIGPRYQWTCGFSEGLAFVRTGSGGGGYVDRNGELVIRADNWDIGDAFRGGIAQVMQGDAWGYIDMRGEYIWMPTS